MTPLREKMVRDMQLRRLSDNTQRVYTQCSLKQGCPRKIRKTKRILR